MNPPNKPIRDAHYRWFILILAGSTATLVIAMPSMAMPVLFADMSAELGLSLVQLGAVWGAASIGGLFTGLLGGAIGDRFGTRATLSTACLAAGATTALIGLAGGFATLFGAVILNGVVTTIVPMNLHKACGMWFSGKRLGLANGVVAAGMALGFLSGSMISATVLSPWLGDWHRVLFFYGAIGLIMSLPWALSRSAPADGEGAAAAPGRSASRQALSQVVRLRNVWLLGIGLLCVAGCVQGLLGYLPLHLRNSGWPPARADAALAAFHAMSLLSVFPLALLATRLGSRKRFLSFATLTVAAGTGSLAVAAGALVWIAVLVAGAVRDGFMAIFMTTVTELDGVGARHAGTALGLTTTLSRLGSLLAPPVGNSLATWHTGMPFAFWAALALAGLLAFRVVDAERVQEVSLQGAPLTSE